MLNRVPGVTGQEIGYWRDVGTLDELYDANMDVCGINPIFNLYNQDWPTRAAAPVFAPAKFSLSSEVYNAIIAEGCIITRGRVINSVLGNNARVEAGATVEFSVIHNGVGIGSGARIRRTIIDKYTQVPPGVCIGCDPDDDRRRGFIITPAGITVVPKRYQFES